MLSVQLISAFNLLERPFLITMGDHVYLVKIVSLKHISATPEVKLMNRQNKSVGGLEQKSSIMVIYRRASWTSYNYSNEDTDDPAVVDEADDSSAIKLAAGVSPVRTEPPPPPPLTTLMKGALVILQCIITLFSVCQ
ncbi:uncharacterized protein [Miscanthus floridulus]|uniref:uncharacterized protein isoform X2 n=2 Tax=Miscanthus floridulus TaxID=154761 RepID=UPI003458FF79